MTLPRPPQTPDEWEFVREAIRRGAMRAAAARNAGGISRQSRMEGESIPEGWRYEPDIAYWVPAKVVLL